LSKANKFKLTLVTSFTFHKNERLKSRKAIGKIFQGGHSFLAYPLKISWVARDLETKPNFPVQFTQSVPKRRFANATQRNRIRRRIREAYRLNKHLINESLTYEGAPQVALMVIYIGKEELPYDQILKATQRWIKTFLKTVKPTENLSSNQPDKH
jgi:ribonuclease P protein component